MKISRCHFFLLSLLLSVASHTMAAIEVGSKIPSLVIEEHGELIVSDKQTIIYKPWSTDGLTGKVHILQYMAGRMSAYSIHEPFTEAFDLKKFPQEFHLTTTIVNLDDTFIGTSGLVNSELKSEKEMYSFASIVADKNGEGAERWQLSRKSSAIVVLSPQGEVLFFKDRWPSG